MSEIINETINKLNKPTQNNVFSIEDNPVTVLEKINQVERYLKEIDTHVDTSINTANEALEKANNAFEANGTLVKINGENQLTWSADFAESERQKSKNLLIPKLLIQGATVFDNGSFSTDTNYVTTSQKINVEPNSQIVMSANIGIDLDSGFVFFNNGVYVGYAKGVITTTVPSNANQVVLDFHATGITPQSITTPQLEYGSVATDYQPYNGAIVHEKQIAGVEHIETIYEMNTKNTIGGKPYTAGIPFSDITISNVDLSPYKHVRYTCRWNPHGDNWFGGTITFDLDLTTPYNSDANYMAVISSRPSNCYIDDSATTFDLVGQIVVNGSKNLFSVNGYKITYTGERTTYTSDNYLPYFRIEKIEGFR